MRAPDADVTTTDFNVSAPSHWPPGRGCGSLSQRRGLGSLNYKKWSILVKDLVFSPLNSITNLINVNI